jgi:hypothetical protein
MIPIRDLFEAHLTVKDLQRSMSFFGGALGLELAQVFRERGVAFYWIGRRGDSMLGLWEVGTGPQRLSLHLAFRVDLDHLLQAPERLRAANITFCLDACCFSVFSRPGWQLARIPGNAARCSAIRPRGRRVESMEVGTSA